jgi:hypothetical protein
MDQLRNALANALPKTTAPGAAEGTREAGAARPLEAREVPVAPDPLPDPLKSEWVARMRQLGVDVPRDPSLGQLTQRSDAACRGMEADGRRRDARDLKGLKETFLQQRERVAWGLVKDRFAELALPEKSYRALKQEGLAPEKALEKLRGKRGEALRGAGHQRVREALLGG